MRSDRLIPGLVLVSIGVIFLLNNYGLIDFHWGNLFRLWPVFLVVGGVNLLLSNTRAFWATAVKVVVLAAGIALVLFASTGDRHRSSLPFLTYHYDDNDNDDDNDQDGDITVNDRKAQSDVYQQLYYPDIKRAKLNIEGGATTYILDSTTDSLFKATTHETFSKYDLTWDRQDSLTTLNFSMRNHNRNFKWNSDYDNEARISLNPIPVWDINLKSGAAETKFDLTPFKIRSLNISGGATSTKVKLASNLSVTEVSVATGASEVEISVPKNAACDIKVSSGLSSNDFDSFTKVSSDHYTTPGFDQAANKIYIHLKGGVSDFNVKRY